MSIERTYVNKRLLSFSHDAALPFCDAFFGPLTPRISNPFVVSAFAMTFEYLGGHTCESFTNSEQFSLGFITIRWVFLVIWEVSTVLAVVIGAVCCSSCCPDLGKMLDILVELLGFRPMFISLSVWKKLLVISYLVLIKRNKFLLHSRNAFCEEDSPAT